MSTTPSSLQRSLRRRGSPKRCQAWETAPDGKSITLYLREGMKWSDGKPFTADDVLFWYNDISLNKEISPNPPKWLVVGGQPAIFEKISDTAFRIKYKQPYALILLELAHYERGYIFAPKHYLVRFHPKYTPLAEAEQNAKAAGFKNWAEAFMIFVEREARFLPAGYPVIEAWKMSVAPPATRAIMERNPYYWKVDTAGNQLPYVDRVVHDFVETRR